MTSPGGSSPPRVSYPSKESHDGFNPTHAITQHGGDFLMDLHRYRSCLCFHGLTWRKSSSWHHPDVSPKFFERISWYFPCQRKRINTALPLSSAHTALKELDEWASTSRSLNTPKVLPWGTVSNGKYHSTSCFLLRIKRHMLKEEISYLPEQVPASFQASSWADDIVHTFKSTPASGYPLPEKYAQNTIVGHARVELYAANAINFTN